MNNHQQTTTPQHSFFHGKTPPMLAPPTLMPQPKGKQAVDTNCNLDGLHASIRVKQDHYRQFVKSLSIAQHQPESLYHKRKRACEAYTKSVMCAHEAPTAKFTSNATALVGKAETPHHGKSKRAPPKPQRQQPQRQQRQGSFEDAVMWELVKDLEDMTNVHYNFIMREVVMLKGKKRRKNQTKHFRF
jgi:hypothetical protein